MRSSTARPVGGVLAGLVPLLPLALVLALTVAIAAGARALAAPQGFYVERAAEGSVMGAGLLVAAVFYGVACARALRAAALLRLAGQAGRARGTLLGLALTAALVLLPVVLAIALPQHPAHPAP
jgi:hypothetical protein